VQVSEEKPHVCMYLCMYPYANIKKVGSATHTTEKKKRIRDLGLRNEEKITRSVQPPTEKKTTLTTQ
jgi:hypothetical protein